MAGKKNIIPQHIPKKQFEHPGKELAFVQALEQIEDPRSPSFFLRYSEVSVVHQLILKCQF